MKYLKIQIDPIMIKGSEEDEETLRVDLYERVQSMLDAETLTFVIVDEEDGGDEDY